MTQMAFKTLKISQLSKDLSLKSKEVIDTFAQLGIEKKSSGATVDLEDFELFLHHMTKSRHIENMED